jgi:WD40 repeat protein
MHTPSPFKSNAMLSTEPRIFLSYALGDGLKPARRVRARLVEAGFSLWQDLVAMQGGRDWWTQIEEALRSPSVEHLVLVVTPSVLDPPVVRREIRLARQEAVQVTPVMGADLLDTSKLPRWIGHVHDLDYPEQWERFVSVLKGPSTQKRMPFMAPDLPQGFVARTGEFGALKAALLDARGDAVGITAALRGAGGYGKTVLANALCHDPDIQDAYFDGILRIELGERPDNLLGLVSDLIKMITGEPEGFNTVDAAASRLSAALGDRRLLLVIDDVWREEDLRPFLRGGPNTTRLVTTRIDNVLPIGTVRVTVDAMRAPEAMALLTRNLPHEQVAVQREALASLCGRLGEWPFLLALANGFLQDRVLRAGEPLVRALDGIGRRLDARGLTAFDAKEADARGRAVSLTIGISLELLDDAERKRFDELAVYPEDTDVPIGIVASQWAETGELDEIDAEDFLLKLFGLSLVSSLDLERRTFRLHDVVRSYLRTKAGKDGVRALNTTLAGVITVDAEKNWIAVERNYIYQHLPAHLDASGDRASLDSLLTNVGWMRAKLLETGPQTLISDYRNFSRSRAQKLIGRVLDLTSGILARDPNQLPVQLIARLAPEDAEGLGTCLAQARNLVPCPALIPYRPTFTAPGAEVRRFEGHDDAVTGLVVLDPEQFVSCSADKTLRVWDAATGFQLRCLEAHEGKVHDIVRLNERHVASSSADKTIRIWDIATGTEVRRIEGHEDEVTCLSLHHNRLLSGSKDNTIRLWNLDTGVELRRFEGHEAKATLEERRGVTAVASMGQSILSAAYDKTLRLWDADSGKEIKQYYPEEEFKFPVLSILPIDPQHFVTGGSDYGVFRLWHVEKGHVRRFEGIRFLAMDFARLDGSCIAIASGGYCEIDVWDLERGERLHRCGGHESRVNTVAVLDAKHLLSGAEDKSIRLWTLEPGSRLERFKGLDWWISGYAILPSGSIVSASWNGDVTLWDGSSGAEIRRFEGQHEGWARFLVLDERRVISYGIYDRDKSIRLWDVDTGKELLRFEGHEKGVTDVKALDPTRIVSASDDRSLRVWHLKTGAQLACLSGHEGSVLSLAVVDAGHVVTASEDSSVRLWDLATGAELRRFCGHEGEVTCVTALPGRLLVSGAADATLRLWDIESGREIRKLSGHHGAIIDVANFDDTHIASVSDDKTIRLWKPHLGQEVARFEGDCAFTLVSVVSHKYISARDSLARLHVFDVRLAQ